MSRWQVIFVESRAKDCDYDEDQLPSLNWDWPKETWLQERLRHLRKTQRRTLAKKDRTSVERLH
jgi:hypothetical protein